MITDTEVRVKGVQALTNSLGSVGAEWFIALIQREPFDYTKWQRTLWEDQKISRARELTKTERKAYEEGK